MALTPSNNTYTTNLAAQLFMTGKDNTYEPQRTNNFELQFVDLGSIKKAGGQRYSKDIIDALNNAEDMILSVKSAFNPSLSVSQLSVQYGNNTVKYAGIPSYSNGTVVWNDFYDRDTERVLKAWQNAAYDETKGAVGDAKDYKRVGYLTMFSPSGRKARRWALLGCWVSDVNGDNFSNDGNSVRALSATFVYDAAYRLDAVDAEEVGSKTPKAIVSLPGQE